MFRNTWRAVISSRLSECFQPNPSERRSKKVVNDSDPLLSFATTLDLDTESGSLSSNCRWTSNHVLGSDQDISRDHSPDRRRHRLQNGCYDLLLQRCRSDQKMRYSHQCDTAAKGKEPTTKVPARLLSTSETTSFSLVLSADLNDSLLRNGRCLLGPFSGKGAGLWIVGNEPVGGFFRFVGHDMGELISFYLFAAAANHVFE